MKEKDSYSPLRPDHRRAFARGFHHGIPIGLGYFAVAFSLGIAARAAGITALQGFVMSLFCKASAGQYAGITLIAAGATLLEVVIATLVTNARYLLMSTALSQKLKPDVPLFCRVLVGDSVTDEIFGVSIHQPGYLDPWFSVGAVCCAAPLWAIGTAVGILAGNILPLRVVSALSVALFGMFLAVFIPPARKSRVIAGLVAVSFLLSWLLGRLPVLRDIAEGTRTIILTLVISAAAALLFPRAEEEEDA